MWCDPCQDFLAYDDRKYGNRDVGAWGPRVFEKMSFGRPKSGTMGTNCSSQSTQSRKKRPRGRPPKKKKPAKKPKIKLLRGKNARINRERVRACRENQKAAKRALENAKSNVARRCLGKNCSHHDKLRSAREKVRRVGENARPPSISDKKVKCFVAECAKRRVLSVRTLEKIEKKKGARRYTCFFERTRAEMKADRRLTKTFAIDANQCLFSPPGCC